MNYSKTFENKNTKLNKSVIRTSKFIEYMFFKTPKIPSNFLYSESLRNTFFHFNFKTVLNYKL